MTNIHTLSGIRTQSLSIPAIKAYSSDWADTGTSYKWHWMIELEKAYFPYPMLQILNTNKFTYSLKNFLATMLVSLILKTSLTKKKGYTMETCEEYGSRYFCMLWNEIVGFRNGVMPTAKELYQI
jgi:hypothetical protein